MLLSARSKVSNSINVTQFLVLSSVLVVAVSVAVLGQIFPTSSESIKFVGAPLPPGLSASSSVTVTNSGLLLQPVNSPNESRQFWIQSQPIASGLSWRPPAFADVTVRVSVPELDQKAFLRAYVRYSVDRVHWSTWQNLPQTGNMLTSPRQFKELLSLPAAAREKYAELMNEWWKSMPAWSSDEHELCVWIATHHPEYFATEIPFIGYVQVRVEGEATQMRVSDINVGINGSTSGLSAIPSGPRRSTADERWFFDLAKFVQVPKESAAPGR